MKKMLRKWLGINDLEHRVNNVNDRIYDFTSQEWVNATETEFELKRNFAYDELKKAILNPKTKIQYGGSTWTSWGNTFYEFKCGKAIGRVTKHYYSDGSTRYEWTYKGFKSGYKAATLYQLAEEIQKD